MMKARFGEMRENQEARKLIIWEPDFCRLFTVLSSAGVGGKEGY